MRRPLISSGRLEMLPSWGRLESFPRPGATLRETLHELQRQSEREVMRTIRREEPWIWFTVWVWLWTIFIVCLATALTFDSRTRFGHWATIHPQLHLAALGVSALLVTPLVVIVIRGWGWWGNFIRPRQASTILLLALFLFAATAHAECAWVLWQERPIQSQRFALNDFNSGVFRAQKECEAIAEGNRRVRCAGNDVILLSIEATA